MTYYINQRNGPERPEEARVLLNLLLVPSVLFFYGLAGVGKTFTSSVVRSYTGWHVYEADNDLTPAMRKAITLKQLFTQEMRDEFFTIIGRNIITLQRSHKNLIVTQAAYKQRNRDYLTDSVPGIEFVWVNASDETIVERLRCRGNQITPEYATQMKLGFEPPAAGAKIIINDSDETRIIT